MAKQRVWIIVMNSSTLIWLCLAHVALFQETLSLSSEQKERLLESKDVNTALDADPSLSESCRLDTLRALNGEIISPKNDGTRPAVFHEHSSLVERLPGGLVRKTLRPTTRNSRQELLEKLTHEAAMLSQLRLHLPIYALAYHHLPENRTVAVRICAGCIAISPELWPWMRSAWPSTCRTAARRSVQTLFRATGGSRWCSLMPLKAVEPDEKGGFQKNERVRTHADRTTAGFEPTVLVPSGTCIT
jgi:hypothetical protein